MNIKYKTLKSGIYVEIDLQNQFTANLFQCILKELSFKIEEEFETITHQERMARACMILSLHSILQKVKLATANRAEQCTKKNKVVGGILHSPGTRLARLSD